jgi:hypothetical protein
VPQRAAGRPAVAGARCLVGPAGRIARQPHWECGATAPLAREVTGLTRCVRQPHHVRRADPDREDCQGVQSHHSAGSTARPVSDSMTAA